MVVVVIAWIKLFLGNVAPHRVLSICWAAGLSKIHTIDLKSRKNIIVNVCVMCLVAKEDFSPLSQQQDLMHGH